MPAAAASMGKDVPAETTHWICEEVIMGAANQEQEVEVDSPPGAGDNLEDFFSFQEVFRRVLASANEELKRSNGLLFWSGVAAGLSLGLTFLARVVFTSIGGATDPGFVGNLMYPIGFVLIVLGRYQLFTENTLTPVALVLTRLATLSSLLRLWAIVLLGNMVGAVVMAAILAWTDVFTAEGQVAAEAIGKHAVDAGSAAMFSRAIIAGWIVASMVWLVHSARDTVSRILIVWSLMFLIGVADLFHVITGTLEVVYYLLDGADGWVDLPRFFFIVLAGNIIGGVLFVAVLNTAQFGREEGGRIAELLRRSARRRARTGT